MAYDSATKLFIIRGWKRLEMNKLITFEDVGERNFESILRRFAVIRIPARSFEPKVLSKMPGLDRDKYGLFAKAPDFEEICLRA